MVGFAVAITVEISTRKGLFGGIHSAINCFLISCVYVSIKCTLCGRATSLVRTNIIITVMSRVRLCYRPIESDYSK